MREGRSHPWHLSIVLFIARGSLCGKVLASRAKFVSSILEVQDLYGDLFEPCINTRSSVYVNIHVSMCMCIYIYICIHIYIYKPGVCEG